MRLRKAEPADLDDVLAIEGSWETTPHWTRRQFEAELAAPGSVFLVAEDATTLSGYGVLWVLEPEAQLLDLAVAPSAARQGVGRALLSGLLAAAKRRGCSALTLEVSARNEAALGLYRAAGARVVGRRPKFYNDGADAILMDLDTL